VRRSRALRNNDDLPFRSRIESFLVNFFELELWMVAVCAFAVHVCCLRLFRFSANGRTGYHKGCSDLPESVEPESVDSS